MSKCPECGRDHDADMRPILDAFASVLSQVDSEKEPDENVHTNLRGLEPEQFDLTARIAFDALNIQAAASSDVFKEKASSFFKSVIDSTSNSLSRFALARMIGTDEMKHAALQDVLLIFYGLLATGMAIQRNLTGADALRGLASKESK